MRLGPGSWRSRKEAELRVPPKPKVAAGTSAGREDVECEACGPGEGPLSAPGAPPASLLTISAGRTAIGPGAFAEEASPHVHAGPSVGTGWRLALFTALAAQEDILAEVLGQQEVPVHVHILEAAFKGGAAQLGRAEPGRRWRFRSPGSWGHRPRGRTEPGGAVLVPQLQLQDPPAQRNLHFVPVTIIQSQVRQLQH